MVQTGDIVRFTFTHTLLGQQVVNVGYWRVDQINIPSVNLGLYVNSVAQYYIDSTMQQLVAALVLREVRYDNITDGIEFAAQAFNTPGAQIGDALPAFNAVNIRQNRATKLTRNGSKRLGGIYEQIVANGVVNFSAAQLEVLEDFWGIPQELSIDGIAGVDLVQSPVIVGRTLNVQGNYELDLSRVNDVTGATLDTTVTSQVSRKP